MIFFCFFSSDGMSIGKSFASKKQYSRQHRAMKESASKNRDNLDSMIPRTQRMTRDVNQPQDPESFAHRLIQKLEIVKRQQENGERLSRHLQDPEMMSFGEVDVESSGGPVTTGNIGDSRGIFFTDQLRQNLFIDDDNDQAILDQHVSRVWADSTPSRSPHGLASPPPRLPERRRPQHAYSRSSKQRRDKDVFSTFSIDSGNIHDFPEGSDLIGAGSMSSLGSHLPKSKSVPSDYADSLHKHDFYLQGIFMLLGTFYFISFLKFN